MSELGDFPLFLGKPYNIEVHGRNFSYALLPVPNNIDNHAFLRNGVPLNLPTTQCPIKLTNNYFIDMDNYRLNSNDDS